MENRVIRVNPERAEFPYFARDNSSGYIWYIKEKSTRRGYLKALLVGEHTRWAPFQYEGEVRTADITKITRMKLTFLIGSNVG